MTVPAVLTATTPSLGVRVWVENQQVCLQAGNEGGRGAPRGWLLLPVEQLRDGSVRQVTDDASRHLQRRSPSMYLPTPATTRFNRNDWLALAGTAPQTAPSVLVLMLFDQRDAGAQGVGDPLSDEIDTAVEAFFKVAEKRPAWLRRGLVCLHPADVPTELPPPTGAEGESATAARAAPVALAATAEPAADQPFTIALASCQYPAGLVDGTPQDWVPGGSRLQGPADASMLRLARRLDDLADPGRPSLLVLAGDQIYADATAGLFDPRAGSTPRTLGTTIREAEDWLRIPYQSWYGSVGPQSVLGRLPSRMMLDDHEIDDNWEKLPDNAAPGATAHNQALREVGRQAYQRYQRNLVDAKLLPDLWHAYRHRGIRFFLADTRTERGARNAVMDARVPRIMGGAQVDGLKTWLAVEPERPAFFVSPSMLLPRRRSSIDDPRLHRYPSDGLPRLRGALHSDAWCGYPGSLHALLALLWRLGRSNVVFLSGDEHLSSVIKATITRVVGGQHLRAVTLHSVHSSALYAPYPFANAVPEEFAVNDAWDFVDPDDHSPIPARYHCQVEPCCAWAPGDGFALLTLEPPPAADGGNGEAPAPWRLGVSFDRAPAAGGPPPPSASLALGPGPGPVQVPPAG